MTRRLFLLWMALWIALPSLARAEDEAPGLEVVRVIAGGQGEQKLLKPGDIVLTYNDVGLTTFADLRQAMADVESAGLTSLIIRVRRRDKVYKVTVKPGALGLELAEVASSGAGDDADDSGDGEGAD